MSPRGRDVAAIAVGVVLVVAAIAHMWWSQPSDTRLTVPIGDTLAVTAAFALGALSARIHPVLPGLMVGCGVTLAVLATLPDSLSGAGDAPPLGYGNANAALLLAAVAGLLVAADRLTTPWRDLLLCSATVAGLMTFFTGSRAGVVAVLVLGALWAVRRRGPAWCWQLAAVVVTAAPVAVTIALAKSWWAAPLWLLEALSANRLHLWISASSLADSAPLRGVGIGNFSQLSPLARADPDLAWAHSAALQRAAEHGWLGLGLVALLILWLIVTIGRDSILVAAMALPASIDYVGSFLWVTGSMAIVLGGAWALASPSRSGDFWRTRSATALRRDQRPSP